MGYARGVRFALVLCVLSACPKHNDQKPIEPAHAGSDGGRQLLPLPLSEDGGGVAALPPAPKLPEIPLGLPPAPSGVLDAVTPEAVALGELLFEDPRMSAGAAPTTCAGCHDPAKRYSAGPGTNKRDPRTPPQLENLAWNPRAIERLPAHIAAEMGQDLAHTAAIIAAVPGYQPHLARVGGTPEQAVTKALTGFVLTRYDANSPWDHQERAAATAKDPVANGYRLFIGKAKCGTCHLPPLYTDARDHDTGFGTATQTRSLRGVGKRAALFSDGSAHSLDEALNHYTTDHPKTELVKINLSAGERADLIAFLGALTGDVPTALFQPLP